MPVVLRINAYSFGFYASDRDEPPHIHVREGRRLAKYWLEPVVLESNRGFRPHELTEVEHMIANHRDRLLEAWNVFFA